MKSISNKQYANRYHPIRPIQVDIYLDVEVAPNKKVTFHKVHPIDLDVTRHPYGKGMEITFEPLSIPWKQLKKYRKNKYDISG